MPRALGPLRRAGSLVVVERLVFMGAQFLAMLLLARHLEPEGFGTFSLAVAIVALVTPFATLGLNHIVTRELTVRPERTATVVGTAVILRLMGAAVGVLLCWLGVASVEAPSGVMVGVVILGLGTVLRAFEVLEYYFLASERVRPFVVARCATSVGGLLGVLIAVRLDASLVTFFAVRAAEFAVLAGALTLAYSTDRGRDNLFRFSGPDARALLQKSWPLMLSSVGAVIYLKIDQVMLGWLLGAEEVGYYAVAAQLSEAWYFLPVAVAGVVFPRLLRSKDRGPEVYTRDFQQFYDSLFSAGLAVAIAVSLSAGPIVTILYGDAFTRSAAILAIHIWAGVFVFMRAGLSKWLIAEELYLFSLVTHGVGALTNVGLNMWWIPTFGSVGAAYATVVSYGMAAYGALFCSTSTRPAAWMMTRAILSPLRLLRRALGVARTRWVNP